MGGFKSKIDRRTLLKGTAAMGAAAFASPYFFTKGASAYVNEPKGSSVTFGFNVPQTRCVCR